MQDERVAKERADLFDYGWVINQRLEARPMWLALKDIVKLAPAIEQAIPSVAVLAVALARRALLSELLRHELFAAVDLLRRGSALGDLLRAERVRDDQELQKPTATTEREKERNQSRESGPLQIALQMFSFSTKKRPKEACFLCENEAKGGPLVLKPVAGGAGEAGA